ncbi:MAG TPA: trypsin-like peptidase domain-containing protein [Exilispira sp.]|nr:trypsin-like peptidase domain-containing protein [Exilispira sp.]
MNTILGNCIKIIKKIKNIKEISKIEQIKNIKKINQIKEIKNMEKRYELKSVFFIIMIIYSVFFISCNSTDKIIKTYSYFPNQSDIEEIFQSKEYNKIMNYYIYFQNSQDKAFKDKLDEKMKEFLAIKLEDDLKNDTNIQNIIRDINNYLYFKIFVINKSFDQKNNENKKIDNFNFISFNIEDELINQVLNYLKEKINRIDNYYLYNSYLSYIKLVFPFWMDKFEELNRKNFDQSKFISSYEDVYKNSVMVILDKGIRIENNQSIPDISIGTGFFIDRDKIITNFHVVNGEGKKFMLSVKINSYTFPASIVAFDESLDLAVLQIPFENKDFKYFKISKEIKIGDEVIASGNPYGLSFSNTKGIVSNIDRKFLEIGNVIQIDAPLNPGNSGGPVFKPGFELIGIAFASISNTQNLNFILPVSFMLDDLFKIENGPEITRSWLGFYFYEDNIIYQAKATQNYNYLSTNNLKDLENIRFLYSSIESQKNKEYYMALQHYICSLPESSFIPIVIKNQIHFLVTERRPKYPIYYSIMNDQINNCLNMIFDAKLTAESEYFKIEKLYNPEISLFYGIYQGDLVKIQNYFIQSQKKIIVIYISIKRSKYGWSSLNIAINLPFSQPGFF